MMEQRSEDWFAVRLGKVTASAISKVTAKTKAGWGADRANYKAQLIAERLTGQRQESFTNAAMQWGIDTEEAARVAYAFLEGQTVLEEAFVIHPTIKDAGASPDGLVGSDGLVEIKCPNTATHIETLKGASIPSKYVGQMQWQMACTGRQWCDFVSFDPRMPEEMQLFVKRLHRDDAYIAELEQIVRDFLAEVEADVAELSNLYRKAA
jgi:putative phage-type endonuclease